MIPTETAARGDAWFLTLSSATDDGRVIWRAAGRLGAAGAAALLQTLLSSQFAGHRLVLDLAGVDYVSGAGVKAVETIAKAVHDSGGSLELVNLAEPVRICLGLAGPLGHVRAPETGGA